jgi:hypothetical protein
MHYIVFIALFINLIPGIKYIALQHFPIDKRKILFIL